MNILQHNALRALLAMFGAQPHNVKPTLPSKHKAGQIRRDAGRSEVAHLSKKERKKRKRIRRRSR